MNENKKPRLCEILGVEVWQLFQVRQNGGLSDPICIDGEGTPIYRDESPAENRFRLVVYAINHPEDLVPLPLWDEDELALLRYLRKFGATIVSKDNNGRIDAWIGTLSNIHKNGESWFSNGAERILTITTIPTLTGGKSCPDPLPHLGTNEPLLLDEALKKVE